MTRVCDSFRATGVWVGAQLGRLAATMRSAGIGSTLRVQAGMYECFSEMQIVEKGRATAVARSRREECGRDGDLRLEAAGQKEAWLLAVIFGQQMLQQLPDDSCSAGRRIGRGGTGWSAYERGSGKWVSGRRCGAT